VFLLQFRRHIAITEVVVREVDHVDFPVLLRGPFHHPLILYLLGGPQREGQLNRRSQIGQVDLLLRLSHAHVLQRQALIDTSGTDHEGRGHSVGSIAHGYTDLLAQTRAVADKEHSGLNIEDLH
jgi:hypothetical protein